MNDAPCSIHVRQESTGGRTLLCKTHRVTWHIGPFEEVPTVCSHGREHINNAPESLLMVKAVADKLDAQTCGDPDAPALIVYRRADLVVSKDVLRELVEAVKDEERAKYVYLYQGNFKDLQRARGRVKDAIARAEEELKNA